MTTLYDILKEVAPKRALFTSYTYSSVWFEAGPYPLLSRGDCEQITVMLDAREARHSVDNSSSRFGGSRYRVVSTTPTKEGKGGGIFHPKIAYLESDDGDVFVVSSANLTTQGQSRSLEVLDAVTASTDPLVFGQIAEFFELLPARLNLLAREDEEILVRFARRARAQRDQYAANAVGPQKVWLVTTLVDDAGAQFVDLARQNLAAPKSLTVLSPYFDKDVGAVVRLRDKLGVKQVRYGLARKDDQLIAPFLEDIPTGNKPWHFVEPPDNGRPLHAKWFELVDVEGEALVMTGSVNATQQSLWNTRNIEVSLVRHVAQSTTAAWTKTDDTPRYIPCEYPAPLASDNTVNAVAHITRNHVLEVRCYPLPAPQDVQLDLYHGEQHLPSLTATLDAQGQASVKVSEKLVRDLPDMALWLTVTGADFEATTWVNVEPQLSAKPTHVDLFKSIGRVEDDVYDEEDAYLLFNAAHLLLTRRKLNSNGRAQRKESTANGTGDPLVSEAEWLAGQGTGTRNYTQPSAEAIRIFKALGKLLEMSDAEIETAFSTNAEDEGAEAGEDDEPDTDSVGEGEEGVSKDERRVNKQRQQRKESVAQARAAVQLAIDQRLMRPMPDALAILAIPQKIRNHLRMGMPTALRGVDTGCEVLAEAVPTNQSALLMGGLSTLMGLRFGPSAVNNLLPMVASAGAITALCHVRRGLAVNYDQIRSCVEIFAGRQLSETDYQGFLETEWRDGRLPLMRIFEIQDLFEQTQRIACAPRVEDRIDSVLALALENPKSPVPEDRKDIEYVVQALRQSPGRNYKLYSVFVTHEVPETVACPQCYATLDKDEFKKLKSVRMAVCKDRCKRPVFLKFGQAANRPLLRENEACVSHIRPKTSEEGEAQ
ncbi:hypothetical protein BFR06_20435 [Burkholderia pseudomallei]|uniref:hypothetical protein n=1 Tax=Burkholderia pseudomallei TaxID=28450 RepID=UPI0004D59C6B|nr:hypothetical protein [Burkholderia pseudomallei]AIP19714.1 PLD-like domain protein [Burkholderia pseudomallei MSHR5855]AIP41781.1 PLD-like domain protein [Burkholderia pseudomallei MSHR5848]APF94270.1 hypothetical protein BFR05_20425 [Burkholderia pseudomallei]APG00314.1 hypothetical protein BFR06_20435 [Burkholderia pseudomallei]KEO70066.1 hypothetical protein J103_08075 [Burkholderia pseudomallei MSHR5855]